MRRNLSLILVTSLLSALILLSVGCGGEVSFTTAKLSEATMAMGVTDDNKPVNATTVFSPETEEIFCSVKLSNAPSDTEVTSVWVYVGGEEEGLTNYEIDNYSVITEGTRYINFSLPRGDTDFPKGDYKLVLYVDGKESVALPFTVR
jgi:hypothetical protein